MSGRRRGPCMMVRQENVCGMDKHFFAKEEKEKYNLFLDVQREMVLFDRERAKEKLSIERERR